MVTGRAVFAVAALAAAALSCSSGGGPEPPDAAQPGELCAELTPDGAWSWPGDPRAISYEGAHSRTYVGWVDSRGSVRVASYDHDTDEIVVATLRPELDPDDHANPSLHVRDDGRLVAFYSAHSGDSLYYRISSRPEDVTAWSEEAVVPVNTPGVNGYTYPNPACLSAEGRVYLFWRGGDFHPCFATTEDWKSWSRVCPFVAGKGRRPYVKIACDGISTIHVAFTNGHPMEEAKNSLYYARYCGGALFRADGSRLADLGELPIDPDDADLVYDASSTGVSAWVWDVAADSLGHPAIVYAAFPEGTDHRYRYARWDSARWHDHEMTGAGGWFSNAHVPAGARLARARFLYYSGGVALDHRDPSIVYLSRPVDDTFEIERWTTADAGQTWKIEPITRGSSADNVRPVVPRNRVDTGPAVVWMHGDYIDFKDFSTSLRIR